VTAYQNRQRLLHERMEQRGVDLVFVPPSGDLEYLTGMLRRVPTFGNVGYAHHWVAGAFFAPGHQPLFVLPRMITEFDLAEGAPGEVLTVAETDDPREAMAKALSRFGDPHTVALGNRTWAQAVLELQAALPSAAFTGAEELINPLRRIKTAADLATLTRACELVDGAMAAVTPHVVPGVTELELAEEVNHFLATHGSRTVSFDTAVWSMGPGDRRDATVRLSTNAVRPGTGVSFDFGAVVDGFCSDFGRTIFVGDPDPEYLTVYPLVIAAQAAGIAAVRPGVTAAEVHAATRAVIVEGGYGDWFRHRTGHCIGMDVHELPYISEEDHTPLADGMTFTIEPSVFWPGRVGARIEDVILCEATSGRNLNRHPNAMVVND
jgi:Xaa-Pro aminopeptidase